MHVLGIGEVERELMNLKISGGPKSGGGDNQRRGRGRRQTSRSRRDSRSRSNSQRRSSSVHSNGSVRSRGGNRHGGGGAGGNRNAGSQGGLKNFKEQLRNRYDRNVLRNVQRYIEDNETSAEVVNNYNYLRRCLDLGLIPREYWMSLASIRNTRDVVRLLDNCSYRLMCEDMDYHRKRRRQLTDQLGANERQISTMMSAKDFDRLRSLTKAHRNEIFEKIRERQRKAVENLKKELMEYQKYLNDRKKPSKKPRRDSSRNNGPRDSRRSEKGGVDDTEGAAGDDHRRVHRRRVNSISSQEASDDEAHE